MIQIPLKEDNINYDCCCRLYRRAVLNCLIELKPTFCLEIGTSLYRTSELFSDYFRRYNPEGKLITTDISKWNRGQPPDKVYPVMVYPYTEDIHSRHGGLNVYYGDFAEKIQQNDIALVNYDLILEEMDRLNIPFHFKKPGLDFAFVDGDHLKFSFLQDLKICQNLLHPDGYILLDDINDSNYSQYEAYRDLKRKNSFYEFDGWNPNPGMALIQNKDLTL